MRARAHTPVSALAGAILDKQACTLARQNQTLLSQLGFLNLDLHLERRASRLAKGGNDVDSHYLQAFHAQRLASLFPGSRFIHLLRDPLQWASSSVNYLRANDAASVVRDHLVPALQAELQPHARINHSAHSARPTGPYDPCPLANPPGEHPEVATLEGETAARASAILTSSLFVGLVHEGVRSRTIRLCPHISEFVARTLHWVDEDMHKGYSHDCRVASAADPWIPQHKHTVPSPDSSVSIRLAKALFQGVDKALREALGLPLRLPNAVRALQQLPAFIADLASIIHIVGLPPPISLFPLPEQDWSRRLGMLWPLGTMLAFYSAHATSVLKSVPPASLLVLRTEDLDHSQTAAAIRSFLGKGMGSSWGKAAEPRGAQLRAQAGTGAALFAHGQVVSPGTGSRTTRSGAGQGLGLNALNLNQPIRSPEQAYADALARHCVDSVVLDRLKSPSDMLIR